MKTYQRGDFTAEKHVEKVLIQLTFNGHHFELPDGKPFDLLKKGAEVELRVRSRFLKEEASSLGLHKQERRELLPAKATLFARVDLRGIKDAARYSNPDPELLHFAKRAKALMHDCLYADQDTVKPYEGLVRIELEQPLVAYRTGQKAFQLFRCDCVITGLRPDPVRAFSLNQALTQISEFAEIHRASHTGSAFLRCLVAVDKQLNPDPDGLLVRLADLRATASH